MSYCYMLQICFTFFLLITLISGRALQYKKSDQDDDSDLLINDDEVSNELEMKSSRMLNDESSDSDLSYDSYEERLFHERAILNTVRPEPTISPNSRQAIIDILQKAFDQGWRPNLKHYIPATRFGRHRR